MVEMIRFGKDHWSLLAYVEIRCVDYKGVLNLPHLRVNENKGFSNGSMSPMSTSDENGKYKYPTRLKGYFEDKTNPEKYISEHDDLDCLEDLEENGLIEKVGFIKEGPFRITELGSICCGALRKHKADGGHFAEFIWSKP